MKKILESVIKELIDNPDDLIISEISGGRSIMLEVCVNKDDISKIGFKCSIPYSRTRRHEIETMYSRYSFTMKPFLLRFHRAALPFFYVL